jgi:hypothetical protein
VADTEHNDPTIEKFAKNGGSAISVVGGLVVAAFLVGWLADMDDVPLWVPAIALFAGVVLWTSTVRPRVLVNGSDLVFRNMLSTVHIPLAAIEEIVVQQVMAVRAGGHRYVCAGVGKSLRQVMKGSSIQRARQQMGSLTGEVAADIQPGIDYGDFVESRVRELVRQDRSRRGITAFSPEMEELGRQVRREPAWPEIGALAATTLFVALALLTV